MITIHTTTTAGQAPAPLPGTSLIASVDVEWTKNYRIKNGNVPFCYSIIYLFVPRTGRVDLARIPVEVTSRYVEDAAETSDLVSAATGEIRQALDHADVLVGHQLSSDLAVLAAAGAHRRASQEDLAHLAEARQAWRQRRTDTRSSTSTETAPSTRSAIVDTRYDAGHVLTGTSRRLVDVCTELRLDVTQPELKGTSMTAVHRRWLETQDREARERVTVLNVRHGLSAALVSLASTGRMPARTRRRPIQVNQMLTRHLPADVAWLQHPVFTATLSS